MLCVVFRINVLHFFLYIRRSIYVAISVMYSSKALRPQLSGRYKKNPWQKNKIKYSVDPTEKQKNGHRGNWLVTDLGVFLVLFAGSAETWRPAIGFFFNFFLNQQKKKFKIKKPKRCSTDNDGLMMYGITICIVSTLLPPSGFSASLLRRGVNKLGPTLDFVVQLWSNWLLLTYCGRNNNF